MAWCMDCTLGLQNFIFWVFLWRIGLFLIFIVWNPCLWTVSAIGLIRCYKLRFYINGSLLFCGRLSVYETLSHLGLKGWCIDIWGCLCLKYNMCIMLTYVVLFATNVYRILCVHQLFGWCRATLRISFCLGGCIFDSRNH